MFIRRCAWHPRYYGYAKFLGISSLRGWTVTFSDGMCDNCAARVREEWGLPTLADIPQNHPRWRPAFPYVTVALAATIAGVALGLVLEPPTNATGPLRILSGSWPAVGVAQGPGPTTVPSASPRGESRGLTAPPVPSSETLAQEAASAPDRARMAALSTRARRGIVRASDRRGVFAVDRGPAEHVVEEQMVADPEPIAPIAPAIAPSEEPAPRVGSGPPAAVELQLP